MRPDEQQTSRAMPVRNQLIALLILVVAAGAGTLIMTGGFKGRAQATPQPRATRFVPDAAQLKSFDIRAVALHPFRDEIVTDGYLAANGSGTAGLGSPVTAAQSSDLLQAEADLTTASAQYRTALETEKRQHQLYKVDGTALKDWQQSQSDLAAASAALASARNRLQLLGHPVAGPGAGRTFRVGDQSTIWLIANIRENDAGLVARGDTMEGHLAAYPGKTVTGTVDFISSVIDPVTHRLIVAARLHNPKGLLRPNMLATVTVLGPTVINRPAVIRDAVVYDGNQAHVWTVNTSGDLSLRRVSLGRTNGNYVEVTAGLQPGERIVTSGALFIDQAMGGD